MKLRTEKNARGITIKGLSSKIASAVALMQASSSGAGLDHRRSTSTPLPRNSQSTFNMGQGYHSGKHWAYILRTLKQKGDILEKRRQQ